MVSQAPTRRWPPVIVAVVVVTLALSTVPLASVAAQETDSAGNQSFVAIQDGECTPVTSLSGDESVREFYDYRVEDPDNPYINTTGDSYASEGTVALQRPNTSILFLYTDTNGTSDTGDDVVSLVFVNGNLGNQSSTGGYATFGITGLADDGRWAVKDDDYDDDQSWDNWSADSGDTVVDWAWSGASTDGGAYAGLDDDSLVVVDASFNEDATYYDEGYYDGTVRQWELLSNESDGTVTRTDLDPDEPLALVPASCDLFEASDDGVEDDGTAVDTETEEGTVGNQTEEGTAVDTETEEGTVDKDTADTATEADVVGGP